jgi:hypothetical protein
VCKQQKRPQLIPASSEEGHRIQTAHSRIVYPKGVYVVQVDCRCLSDTMKEPGQCCVAKPVLQFIRDRDAYELLNAYLLKLAGCPTKSVFIRDRCALLQAQEEFRARFAEKGVRIHLCELQANEPPTPTASQTVIARVQKAESNVSFPGPEVGGALQWALFVADDVENFQAEHLMEDLDVASSKWSRSTELFPKAENATPSGSEDDDGVL